MTNPLTVRSRRERPNGSLGPTLSYLTPEQARTGPVRHIPILLCTWDAKDLALEQKKMQMSTVTPKTRLKNPAAIVPEAMAPLQALGQLLGQLQGPPARALSLAMLRVSQLNGCALCLDGSCMMLKKFGETEERLFAVSAWRESARFTAPERAALSLAEAMTRMSDRSDPVPDAVWDEAARHFDERELSFLVLGIAAQNLYNRINVTTRQVAADWDAGDPEAAKKWGA
jgi:AhpD family alkylhydroperoxidase